MGNGQQSQGPSRPIRADLLAPRADSQRRRLDTRGEPDPGMRLQGSPIIFKRIDMPWSGTLAERIVPIGIRHDLKAYADERSAA